jgi:(2R)-sulfolactate sulfo-lyase subunit alpha
MSETHFLVHDKSDSVGVVVVETAKAGMELIGWVMDTDETVVVKINHDIPIGHKLAMSDIATEGTVIKYGYDIGKVVADIKKGDHVHVHNVKTKMW